MNITELEQAFAKKIGVKHCIAVNSGTSALHTCLYVLGVQAGDEVISPGLTVMMNTFATLYLNATPVYADVCEDTFLIDPADIERKITPKTKAIQIVSLFGLPCEVATIMDIAARHNLPVLEDNAQCFMGRYKNVPGQIPIKIAGSVPHMSIFSTESSKHITSGEGGFICTNDAELALKARKFAGLGYRTLTVDEGRPKLNKELFHMPDFKRHDVVGFNYRMPQACVDLLAPQVRDLEIIVNRRIENAMAFDNVLAPYPFFKPQPSLGNSYWTYATVYSGPIPWKEFYQRFRDNGGEGFHGSLSLPYLEPVMEGTVASCPVAEKLQPNLMLFHTNYKTTEELNVQIEALRKTLETL